MMSTDDTAGDVLSEVFAQHAEDRADTQLVLADLRRRIERRRHLPSRPVAMLATAVAVVALALGAAALADHSARPVALAGQPASNTPGHPGEDQLSKSCLNMSAVLAAWVNPAAGYGGIGSDESSAACSHEADTILPTHPPAASTVIAGDRTIYMAESPPGIRTGYLALDPIDSAAAARANGQQQEPNRPYYLIVSIPADNPQSVLVSILQQFVLPGH